MILSLLPQNSCKKDDTLVILSDTLWYFALEENKEITYRKSVTYTTIFQKQRKTENKKSNKMQKKNASYPPSANLLIIRLLSQKKQQFHPFNEDMQKKGWPPRWYFDTLVPKNINTTWYWTKLHFVADTLNLVKDWSWRWWRNCMICRYRTEPNHRSLWSNADHAIHL